MRRELGCLAVLLCAITPAGAETRVLVGGDAFLSTEPGTLYTDAADVAWSTHLEWRAPERRREVVIDLVDRESLIGGLPRRELHLLAYTDRSLAPWSITVGRFRTPAGFWLFADGAALARTWGGYEVSVFGGSRSFTNARGETLLRRHPAPLPLAGAALVHRGTVQAALAYVYTADRITVYRGGDSFATSRQPEQFLDADVAAPIGAHAFVTAGASVGSRYLLGYPSAATQLEQAPSFENVWFGARSAYGLYDLRIDRWRLTAGVGVLQTKIGQQPATGDAPALAAIDGSFGELAASAGWRRADAGRVELRYRARVRDDGSRAQRAMMNGIWHIAWLEVAAHLGIDLHHIGTPAPGRTSSKSVLYGASVGRRTESWDAELGVHAVGAFGDEIAVTANDPNAQRTPYTLEGRTYAFVQSFARRDRWFVGVAAEINLAGDGVRTVLQVGWSN